MGVWRTKALVHRREANREQLSLEKRAVGRHVTAHAVAGERLGGRLAGKQELACAAHGTNVGGKAS